MLIKLKYGTWGAITIKGPCVCARVRVSKLALHLSVPLGRARAEGARGADFGAGLGRLGVGQQRLVPTKQRNNANHTLKATHGHGHATASTRMLKRKS